MIYLYGFIVGFIIGGTVLVWAWKGDPDRPGSYLSIFIIGGIVGGIGVMFLIWSFIGGGEPYDYPGEHMI